MHGVSFGPCHVALGLTVHHNTYWTSRAAKRFHCLIVVIIIVIIIITVIIIIIVIIYWTSLGCDWGASAGGAAAGANRHGPVPYSE